MEWCQHTMLEGRALLSALKFKLLNQQHMINRRAGIHPQSLETGPICTKTVQGAECLHPSGHLAHCQVQARPVQALAAYTHSHTYIRPHAHMQAALCLFVCMCVRVRACIPLSSIINMVVSLRNESRLSCGKINRQLKKDCAFGLILQIVKP